MSHMRNWLRRSDTLQHTPAEKAITDAMEAVESLPPDTRLTKAISLLTNARMKVADYVEGYVEDENGLGPNHDRA